MILKLISASRTKNYEQMIDDMTLIIAPNLS